MGEINDYALRVLVCGGRDFTDWGGFRDRLEKVAQKHFPRMEEDRYGNYLYDVVIIHGGAPGVDDFADRWAIVNLTGIEIYKADWALHGKAAGPIRNQQMLDEGKPDLVVAFPGGRGTSDMVRRAQKAGVKVIYA